MIALHGGTAALDDNTLAELFASDYERALRLAYLFHRDRAAAEDVVQEAFLQCHRYRARLRDVSAAPAYLRQTVVNLCRGRLRRVAVAAKHPEPAPDDRDAVDDTAVAGERGDDRRAVLRAIDTLPARQRECVILRYYLDLGDRDIAAALGISAGSVKQHLHRALGALSLALEDRR